jgi:hypothetical protein
MDFMQFVWVAKSLFAFDVAVLVASERLSAS